MDHHVYVSEKLREFAHERRSLPPAGPRRKKRPFLQPLARRAGRALRRVGEGLEAWGGPRPVRKPDIAR